MKILADATLPNLTAWFPKPFSVTLYNAPDQLPKLLKTHDILLCRSTLKVTSALLTNSTIQCVATASSGVDHIDGEYLAKNKITLLDAKGSNARSVADYVMANLALLQRHHKLIGNRVGIIGVGEVGSRVLACMRSAGFEVVGYDPLKAMHDSSFISSSLDELVNCDLICIHASLHDTKPFPTKQLLDTHFLKRLKSNAAIINASRGGIVDEDSLLQVPQPITYCTDVYSNEPSIDARIVDFAWICTPHIAGHSIEAKQAVMIQISQKLHHQYGLAITSSALKKEAGVVWRGNWQDSILAIYNPLNDTQILKTAANKEQTFLTQRKAHQYRHDFVFTG